MHFHLSERLLFELTFSAADACVFRSLITWGTNKNIFNLCIKGTITLLQNRFSYPLISPGSA